MEWGFEGPPLQLSRSLYDWQVTEGDEVDVDHLHNFIIHIQKECFFVHWMGGQGEPPYTIPSEPKLYNFSRPLIRLIRFAPRGTHFAFLADSNNIGIVDSNSLEVAVKPWGDVARHTLTIFWLPEADAGFGDLVCISNMGLEIFRFYYSTLILRCNKKFKDYPTGYAVTFIAPSTLQPYLLHAQNPVKLPTFDLANGARAFDPRDFTVCTFYGATYCIHCDCFTGRISVRSISGPYPSQDILLECNGPGLMRLSIVDNLLAVHRPEQCVTAIFDVGQASGLRESGSKESLLPLYRPTGIPLDSSISSANFGSASSYCNNWHFVDGCDLVIDRSQGSVYRLVLVMDSLCKHLELSKSEFVSVLVRRQNCRSKLLEVLHEMLLNEETVDVVTSVFEVINENYRTEINMRLRSNQDQQTVTLEKLIEASKTTLITERDVVVNVFLTTMTEMDSDCPIFTENITLESCRHQLEEIAADEIWGAPTVSRQRANDLTASTAVSLPLFRHYIEKNKSHIQTNNQDIQSNIQINNQDIQSDIQDISNPPYLLCSCLAYLTSLLAVQIVPNKILQCFVFDMCVYYNQFGVLFQILQYHVFPDSLDISLRLLSLWRCKKLNSLYQVCADTAVRLQEWGILVCLLCDKKKYLKVIPMLRRGGVPYPLKDLLHRLTEDMEAQKEDPDLLPHVMASIKRSQWLTHLFRCQTYQDAPLGCHGAKHALYSLQKRTSHQM
eukprot:GHVL01000069.1.p1 GENE.GHVL01000069.1~~GHVL01000069.1.p1  ORF type:complete len:724 (-),score=81.03 GHVL01000069.1:652-2823(-)